MRRIILISLALAAAFAAFPHSAMAGTWRVTIKNLDDREGKGQPLSPPLVVVHSRRVDVWEPGDRPSPELAQLAEDGQNTPFAQLLGPNRSVRRAEGVGMPIEPGSRLSFTVRVTRRSDRLSLLTMLVNTNDGFTGLDSVRLRGRRTKKINVIGWDAGSERNNERAGFIPGPCCQNPFMRDPENRRVRRHTGIRGRQDLARSDYHFRGPVARIIIRRVRR